MNNRKRQTPFCAEVARAERLLKEADKAMLAVKQKLDSYDIDGAYLEAFELAAVSEKLTLLTRQLPAYTGNPQASKMADHTIIDNVSVQMGFTPEGWFGVVIPTLLPKKSKGSTEYIRGILYLALEQFFKGKTPVRYTDCVLVFRHVYRRDRPERQYRDHDNIEVNMVADTLALYVLFDDTPLRCSHYYCSTPGDEDRTEIFVVPQREFGAWIRESKNYHIKGVTLHAYQF